MQRLLRWKSWFGGLFLLADRTSERVEIVPDTEFWIGDIQGIGSLFKRMNCKPKSLINTSKLIPMHPPKSGEGASGHDHLCIAHLRLREEPYEAQVMDHYDVRIIIGKGGMGADTLAACKKVGAIYLHAVGGAAVKIADSVKRVREVHMLDEFGVPEAFWVCEVEGFKGVVTMDSRGRSLHTKVLRESKKARAELLGL